MKKFALETETPKGIYVLMFSAKWCSACKEMKRRFDEEEYSNLPIYEVDVETNRGIQMATNNNVKSLPTWFICEGEKMLEKRVGTMPVKEMKSWIKQYKEK